MTAYSVETETAEALAEELGITWEDNADLMDELFSLFEKGE